MRLGIFYGSTLGRTAGVARRIAARLPGVERVGSVAGLRADDLSGYDALVLGTSTWYLGELQDDWAAFLREIVTADLRGRPVALFGLGDQDAFPDTFADALGHLRACVAHAGADVRAGHTSPRGYNFRRSRALLPDGRFCGLVLDEDCQPALTDERLDRWCARLRRELRPAGTRRGVRRVRGLLPAGSALAPERAPAIWRAPTSR